MHVVMMSSAAMPVSCYGRYMNVAVVQLNQEYTAKGWRPKFIAERARGVLRIVWHSGPRSFGKTDRCAYRRALRQADDLVFRLNNAADLATVEQIIGAGGSA